MIDTEKLRRLFTEVSLRDGVEPVLLELLNTLPGLFDAYDHLDAERVRQAHTSDGKPLNDDQAKVWGTLTRADVIVQAERVQRRLGDFQTAYANMTDQRDKLQAQLDGAT